jgi:hypothetical protein
VNPFAARLSGKNAAVKWRAEELLALPVRVRGIELGRPVDLLIDRKAPRAVGFEILCGDQAHRFLPFAVTTLKEDAIEIESPLVLLDFAQVGFYREQATTLSELNGDAGELFVDLDGSIKGITPR